jgi:hypothetical protein
MRALAAMNNRVDAISAAKQKMEDGSMKQHACCKMGRECANCDNSKFAALFRGNVPLHCKRQFFARNFAGAGGGIRRAILPFNGNLTASSYADNFDMKSSLHACGEGVATRRGV